MPEQFDAALNKLGQGQHLTRSESRQAMLHLMSGAASDAEIRQFLTSLPIDRASVDELAGFASVMRQKVISVPTGNFDVLDTCGTGGDVRHTFNISTAAALIAAAAGIKVVKHGNRSASSRCGSADVLEKLGVKLELGRERLGACLEEVGICFAFARSLHPAMKHVASVRRELGVPTIFNLMGPLTNPGEARYSLLGVFSPWLTERLALVLKELGSRRAWVVHAEDGLDEISIASPTCVSELNDGQIQTWTLRPGDLGIPAASLSEIQVGGVEEAAQFLMDVLSGQSGPKRDIALLNAAAALVIAGRASELAGAMAMARDAVDSGKARQTLERLIRFG